MKINNELIQAIYDWNPWLFGDFPSELLGKPRAYDLTSYLKVPEIKIIEGARRVGKSTLMYQIMHQLYQEKKNILYINFEDEILQKYTLTQVLAAYSQNSKIDYLFVDEVQNCDDWVPVVRKLYDRKEMQQIWISGSNACLIKQEYATLLTGRNLTIHVYSLSFDEFLTFKNINNTLSSKQQSDCEKFFHEYINYGAFPAIAKRTVLKKELLIAYFDDFIYKDIVARHNVNATKIKELAIYLATNASKMFSYRKIATALNVHFNTILDYCNYLKEAFLFTELYKFDFSLKKQYSNDKKIYCLDIGLAAAVSFRFSQDLGRVLENLVFCELKRRGLEIYFHKDKLECDFLIKQELDIIQAIQVCVSLKDEDTAKRELAGLLEALAAYKLRSGIILTLDEQKTMQLTYNAQDYTLEVLPVWQWLLANS